MLLKITYDARNSNGKYIYFKKYTYLINPLELNRVYDPYSANVGSIIFENGTFLSLLHTDSNLFLVIVNVSLVFKFLSSIISCNMSQCCQRPPTPLGFCLVLTGRVSLEICCDEADSKRLDEEVLCAEIQRVATAASRRKSCFSASAARRCLKCDVLIQPLELSVRVFFSALTSDRYRQLKKV